MKGDYCSATCQCLIPSYLLTSCKIDDVGNQESVLTRSKGNACQFFNRIEFEFAVLMAEPNQTESTNFRIIQPNSAEFGYVVEWR